MSLIQVTGPDNFQGLTIQLNGMITAEETGVGGNKRMLPGQAVAFAADVQECVDQQRFAFNQTPDGGGRLDQFFLKNRHIRIPADLEGHLRTQADTLGATDTQLQIIAGITIGSPAGRMGGADLETGTATGTTVPDQNGAGIAVNALFLSPGRESHGNILDGAAESPFQVPLEMGENKKSRRLFNDISNLNSLEIFVSGSQIDEIAAIHAIGNDYGAA